MKIRVIDRIVAGIMALLLLGTLFAIAAQYVFQIPITAWVRTMINQHGNVFRIVLPVLCVILLLFILSFFSIMCRHHKKKDRSVSQITENGSLTISLATIQKLVEKCIKEYQEIQKPEIELENNKKGLSISIRASIAGGISIPLTVAHLQKQVHQYVTSCSGIDIKDVRVRIVDTGKDIENAPFAIEGPKALPLLKASSENKDNEMVSDIASLQVLHESDVSSEVTEEDNCSVLKNNSEQTCINENDADIRPLHQRIFSQPESPCIVPCPPNTEFCENESAEDIAALDEDSQDMLESIQETQNTEELE